MRTTSGYRIWSASPESVGYLLNNAHNTLSQFLSNSKASGWAWALLIEGMRLLPVGMLAVMTLISGCSHAKVFEVESNPQGARIEVNGIQRCDSTPCKIDLNCSGHATGKKYSVQAIPAKGAAGSLYASQKTINPCEVQGDTASLFFDLNSK